MRSRGCVWFVALAIAGCGDSADPGPRPLVEDPAVEVGCLPGPVAAGVTRAKVVACAEELIGGRLAGGRVGDFVIENEKLRVIVRGPGEGYYLHGASGGGIIDAAAVGGEDLVKEILPSVDFAVGAFDELVIVEAGDDAPAELVVRGPAVSLEIIAAALDREPPPVTIEHHYRLAAGADALELDTRVFANPGSEPADYTLYDAVFLGGRAAAFLPGKGFAAGQGATDIIATTGTTTSYGLAYPAGAPSPQLIDLAGIRLVQGPTVDAVGQRRFFVIGDGSISSVIDHVWPLRDTEVGGVAGTSAPGVDLVASDAARNPITIARADSAGAFHFSAPPGDYTVQATTIGRDPGPSVAVTITAGADAQLAVPAGPGGKLSLTVVDDAATPIPARVVIERAGSDRRIEFVGASGKLDLAIPPGTWSVSVSRGLEYDAFIAASVAIADGQTTNLAATLAHVVDTAGWISLDTHLHSELSTDSTFPLDDRLRAVAAEGVELPVSADHDFITDYAPTIAELGLGDWIGSLTGEEASSLVWGHINAFPLAPDDSRAGRGAVLWRDRTPGDVFAALRGSDPSRIVQANHPRRSSTNLFNAIDLDPTTLIAHRDPTDLNLPATADLNDLSFDAVEVANAVSDNDFEAVFADWLHLVAAGHPAAPTGSSDSHGAGGFAGEARTYVYVGPGADNPATIDPAAITAGIRARHVVVGTGGFVTAGIVAAAGTSLPGDTANVPAAAPLKLHIHVQAASWQPLGKILIYERAQQIKQIDLDVNDAAPSRFDADVILPAPTTDTFFVVRVDAGGRGDPVIENAMPCFTGPLFVHVVP
jgi:hypothetical protein